MANMFSRIIRSILGKSLGFRELGGGWNEKTANTLRMDCSGKLPVVELKWILVYCDLHYVVKDSAKEVLLLFELAGRQMGMPSPHGDISTNYKFSSYDATDFKWRTVCLYSPMYRW